MVKRICYDVELALPWAREFRPTLWLPKDMRRLFSWRESTSPAGAWWTGHYAAQLELDQFTQLLWALGLRAEGEAQAVVRAVRLGGDEGPFPPLRLHIEQPRRSLRLDASPAPGEDAEGGGAFEGWREMSASLRLLEYPAPVFLTFLLRQREAREQRLVEYLAPFRRPHDPIGNTRAFCERYGMRARFPSAGPTNQLTLQVIQGGAPVRQATFWHPRRLSDDELHALHGFFVEVTDALSVQDYSRRQFTKWAADSEYALLFGEGRAREYWCAARSRVGSFRALVGEEVFWVFCAVDFA